MTTPSRVLDIERRWLDAGTREVPNGSNNVDGITDQPGRWDAAWCDMFQMECLLEAGVPVGPGKYGSASVIMTFNYYRSISRTFKDPTVARPGDLIGFHFQGGHTGLNHVGMIESIRPDGFVTIEGNVGNRVQRLFRHWGDGSEFARPAYTEAADIPPAVVQPPSRPGVYTLGSRGDFVRQIQKVVGVPIDGIYGPKTVAAVRNWQSKLKVPVDGVWGPDTQAATSKYFDFLMGLANEPDTPPGGDILSALQNASRSFLRTGSHGDNVKILQTLLQNQGIQVSGGVDGVFGDGTQDAVVEFQKRNGLVQDGLVGPNTWRALLR